MYTEDYPGEWGNVPLAYSKVQNSSGGTDLGQLTRSLEKQIAKAAGNHDDAVVAVMKEVKALLQKGFTKDSEHGIIALGDWDESKHPRDENGRFTASGDSGEEDASGSERTSARYPTVKLSKKEYAKVISEINTNYYSNYDGKEKGFLEIAMKNGYCCYRFEIFGFDDYNIYEKEKRK